MKGAQEALANERKYGHAAGPLGKAMADLEAERVKRDDAARSDERLLRNAAENAARKEGLRATLRAQAALAQHEVTSAWRALDTAAEALVKSWHDADDTVECPACISRVPRRARVCAHCRHDIPLPTEADQVARAARAAAMLSELVTQAHEQVLVRDRIRDNLGGA